MTIKNLLPILALLFAGCAAAEAATSPEDCCMPLNEGQINRAGIRILMQSETEPLAVPPNGAIAYLKIVDGDGNVIAPEYEPDGLQTGMGALSGAKYTLVSAAALEALTARVATLEALILTGTAPIAATVTFDRIKVKTIEAYSPGTYPDTLRIVVPGPVANTYDTMLELVAKNNADITPATRMGFYGATPVIQQDVSAAGGDAAIRAASVAQGLIVEVP